VGLREVPGPGSLFFHYGFVVPPPLAPLVHFETLCMIVSSLLFRWKRVIRHAYQVLWILIFASPIHGMQVAQGFIDLALKQGGNITAENMSFDPLLITGSHRLLHVQRCTNYISVQSVGMAVAPARPIEYWLEI